MCVHFGNGVCIKYIPGETKSPWKIRDVLFNALLGGKCLKAQDG